MGYAECTASVQGDTVEISFGFRPRPPREPVAQVFAHEGHPDVALIDLGKDMSDALRASWNAGRSVEPGGVIESAWLQPIFGAGGVAASSLLSGNVFLATANPATLMTIGSGVGSAVVGPSGIVAQAPFVAASSALLPVVAPVMLFMTVSAIVTGARLDRMQKTLGELSEVLERLRQLEETDAYATFQSAAQQLDGVWSQFEHGRRFTEGMKAELVQARRDLNRLHHQYGHLADREIRSEADARAAVSDINLFFLSSVMDLRADVLRMYLTLQENPEYAEQRQVELARKVERCNDTFAALLDNDPIEGFHNALQRELSEARFCRHLPSWCRRWFDRGLSARIRRVEAVRDTFKPVRERIERWTDTFGSASIVVYRDEDGELHAHHTRDLQLRQTGA